MSFIADYRSPLPKMPLSDAISIASVGASTGVLVYFPFLRAAQAAKVTKISFMRSLITLFHEATKKPLRTMYGRLPWSMVREAQWVTKYPTINWVNQNLELQVSNSHLRLLISATAVAIQESVCYGLGDYLYTCHEISGANNWTMSTKDHVTRALRSRRMGAIPYVATNMTWQFMTMDGISALQQSLPGRVKASVPRELLISISIFFPTLLATITMIPFNAVKTVMQISSKEKVLGITEAVSKLNFRVLYRGTWPTIFLATAKITTGLTIATILSKG